MGLASYGIFFEIGFCRDCLWIRNLDKIIIFLAIYLLKLL